VAPKKGSLKFSLYGPAGAVQRGGSSGGGQLAVTSAVRLGSASRSRATGASRAHNQCRPRIQFCGANGSVLGKLYSPLHTYLSEKLQFAAFRITLPIAAICNSIRCGTFYFATYASTTGLCL